MRHIVTSRFYINAKDDNDAVFKAKYIAARQSHSKSDECEIIQVDEADEQTQSIKNIYYWIERPKQQGMP